MNAFLRLVSALLLMSAQTVTFGTPHRYLPRTVHLSSPGLVSLAVAFFLVGGARYVLVEGNPATQLFFSQALYLVLLLACARFGWVKELAVYLAASTGVDLVMAALGVVGLDTKDPTVHDIAFYWEWVASVVAVCRMRYDDKLAANTKSAD